MGSATCFGAFSNSYQSVEADSPRRLSIGLDGSKIDSLVRATPVGDWHSIPLEDPSFTRETSSFRLAEVEKSDETSRKVELSSCGFTKQIGVDGSDKMTDTFSKYDGESKKDYTFITIGSSDDMDGGKEGRLSFHGAEDKQSKCNIVKKADTLVNDAGCGDEGCLSLVHQVRAFIKGAKLSCGSLMSGDSKSFDRWSSFLQRSFSFRSCDASSTEGEPLCENTNSSHLTRSVSMPMSTISQAVSTGATEAVKVVPLQARDPQARAEALPLAHYRPTDGTTTWKNEEFKGGLCSPGACKSPSHGNCKKPPKPPRHPSRSTSMDSSALVALRNARKNRDRASAKRKSKAAAATSTAVTPLVALVLTIGFGVLMVFQGVFVQTNASYGKNVDRAFVDSNLRTSLIADKVLPFHNMHLRTPLLPTSSNMDKSYREEVVVKEAFRKSMEDLPWSRSSLSKQVEPVSR